MQIYQICKNYIIKIVQYLTLRNLNIKDFQ